MAAASASIFGKAARVCVLLRLHTWDATVRTTLDIDRGLLEAAMAPTGLATKKATIEQALRSLVDRHRRKNAIADLAGIGWEGDLDEIRHSPADNQAAGG